MRPTIHTLHTPRALVAWLAIQSTLCAWHEALKRRREARRRYEALAHLDDRTLRDLGIDRSEIDSYAHEPADLHRARVYRSIFGVY
jgi:uncharacterized protein YjiS (DUF1127 family)